MRRIIFVCSSGYIKLRIFNNPEFFISFIDDFLIEEEKKVYAIIFYKKKICKKVQFDKTAHCLPQKLKLMGFLEIFLIEKAIKGYSKVIKKSQKC